MFQKLLIIRSPGIGPVRYAQLINKFGSVSAAVSAMEITNEFRDSVMQEMEFAYKHNIQYISDESDLYPAELKRLKNHPPIINVRSNNRNLVFS